MQLENGSLHALVLFPQTSIIAFTLKHPRQHYKKGEGIGRRLLAGKMPFPGRIYSHAYLIKEEARILGGKVAKWIFEC